MSQTPISATQEVVHGPVSEFELDIGVGHAKKQYEKDISRDLLRVLVNTTLDRREPKSIMPFLASTVVREHIPLSDKERAPKIDAYKGAIMKILSQRSAIKRKRDAERRKLGVLVSPRPKQTEHPEDPKNQGQFLLFSLR